MACSKPITIYLMSSQYSVQFSSLALLFPTLYDPIDCSKSGLPVHHQLLEFTRTYVHWVSDSIQPSHPLSSPSPTTCNLSQHQGLFKCKGSVLCIRWPNWCWSFSLSISTSNEYSALISFRMDLLDPLAVQETQKSCPTPQFKSINFSVLSFFFILQVSHAYMTTGKAIIFTRWTFVGKVKSLLYNTPSRLIITFLSRSKCFFNFMATVTICSDFGTP